MGRNWGSARPVQRFQETAFCGDSAFRVLMIEGANKLKPVCIIRADRHADRALGGSREHFSDVQRRGFRLRAL